MGEVFALTWQDVDLRNKIIYIRNPKNDEARQAYLTPNLVEVFNSLSKEKKRGLIFPDNNGNKMHQLSNTFDRAVIKLGLNDGVTDRLNRIVPHTLRHTFASWLVMNGTPLFEVSKLLRHASIQMTERYAHLAPDHLQNAIANLGFSSQFQLTENLQQAVVYQNGVVT